MMQAESVAVPPPALSIVYVRAKHCCLQVLRVLHPLPQPLHLRARKPQNDNRMMVST